ncbi:plasmid partitioning protein RepB [Bradyrhizobium sp. Leo121]|uniref:plasmid partitioning protein RepB n=1 Tax=Bradyrhizobium sp. Leo121 TaxID=1571195 RepID=UPI001029D4D7|nr:plasmid partitioning protein RepB [Bradyrhizobium sp. Leo121]RZN16078.1 plasmid partitioning protein RepB [Bradyrhizobium sp. Leo121]
MRKNIFSNVIPAGGQSDSSTQQVKQPVQRAGPLSTLSGILENSAEETRRLQETVSDLNKQLQSGVNVVEIDPALIDPSPIRDRLDDPASDENESLRASIAESGQRVPALLRPNPSAPGRYLTVFGHRRVAAVKALGRPLKAVVTDIGEEEALVAQGQENNERNNTSFIEKCLFARRLKDRGLKGERLVSAISASKSTVYKMIEVASMIPEDVIIAIGPAPSVGRPRWATLAETIPSNMKVCRRLLGDTEFLRLGSDERFNAVFAAASRRETKKSAAADFSPIAGRNGSEFALVKRSPSGDMTVKIPKNDGSSRKDGRPFGEWLESRMASLYDDWLDGQ